MAADLRLQLELAYDIEDWDKVRELSRRLWQFEVAESAGRAANQWAYPAPGWRYPPPGNGPMCGSDAWYGGDSCRRWPRSRSPHRGRKAHHPDGRRSADSSNGGAAKEYNKSIKTFLLNSNVGAAREVLSDMRRQGVRPTVVTYNEFLNFCAKASDSSEALKIMSEMRSEGIDPNLVSASTILKAVNDKTPREDTDKIVDLIRLVVGKEGIDEILLSSLAEATVRVGHRMPKLLTTLRNSLKGQESAVWSVKTCGSLIRAYGHAGDMPAMWQQWNSMLSNGVRPSAVTTGCMVEQLVLNDQASRAHEVVRDLDRRGYSDCINVVVYSSLLKGFAREKSPEQVWGVYKEMHRRGLKFTISTYNALVGALSQCGMMSRAMDVFAEMQVNGTAPTVCTWTRLAKGFCMSGEISKAEDVMERMQMTTGLQPDDIFYHSLLDGCAEHGLVEKGASILERMEKDQLKPSKYSMSIISKMMVKANRVRDGCAWVEKLSRKHGIAVGTNIFLGLVNACKGHEDRAAAAGLFRQMVLSGERPEKWGYNVLLKGCVCTGSPAEAAAGVRPVLAAGGGSDALRSLIDQQMIRDALESRLETDSSDEVRAIAEELREATDQWFSAGLRARGADPAAGELKA
mmetsp:Transcript_63413/g.176439  ORF Transcript_63413/g.176439 Transcript_63413/m.176439 type:complete len:629 (+) Transcript_63413:81-1967(+)